MKRFLLPLLLIITSSYKVYSQQIWKPIGPNDENASSHNSVRSTKSISKNDNLYTLSVEFKAGASGYKLNLNFYDGVKWNKLGNSHFIYSNYSNGIDFCVDNNNIVYLAYVKWDASISKDRIIIIRFINNNWEIFNDSIISNDIFEGLSILTDSNNNVLINYSNNESNYKQVVKKFDGSTWLDIGNIGFSNGFSFNSNLKMDSQNNLYISYLDNSVTDINGFKKLFIKKIVNNSWVDCGLDLPYFDTNVQQDEIINPLNFDNNNIPYIFYNDVNNNNAIIKRFNGIIWDNFNNTGITNTIKSYTNIKFDAHNLPYIVYISQINDTLKPTVMKYNGINWDIIGQTDVNAISTTSHSSIHFINNELFISYKLSDFYNTGARSISAKFEENIWKSIGDNPISIGIAESPQIAIDSNTDLLYSSFYDKGLNRKILVKKFINNNWEDLSSNNVTNLNSNDFRFKLDKNNVPYILVGEYINNTFKLTLKKFINNDWEIIGIQGINDNGVGDFNFNFDNNNIPFIVYRGGNTMADNQQCSVQRFNGNNWENVGNLYFSYNEANKPNIVFDSNNMPIVSFLGNRGELNIMKFSNNSWSYYNPLNQNYLYTSTNILNINNNDELFIGTADSGFNFSSVFKVYGTTSGFLSNNTVTPELIRSMDFKLINNIPYVVYPKIVDNIETTIECKRFINNNWELVGENKISAGNVTFFSISSDINNRPYICYADRYGCIYFKYLENELLSTTTNTYFFDKFQVYPNPVKKYFSVSSSEVINEIEIFNLIGKRVLHKKNMTNEINIENLPSGIYVAKIKTDKGTLTSKLIKE